MDLHIGQLTSEVEVGDSADTLAPEQIERIAALVIARIERRERERRIRSQTLAIDAGLLRRLPWE